MKIEKNIPVGTSKRNVYPWDDMKSGDSILITDPDRIVTARNSAYGAAKRRGPGWKAVTRIQDDGSVRIWLMEDDEAF